MNMTQVLDFQRVTKTKTKPVSKIPDKSSTTNTKNKVNETTTDDNTTTAKSMPDLSKKDMESPTMVETVPYLPHLSAPTNSTRHM
eukprot:10886596-Ditylum_brightwellii.AAC.1